ncbi:hypothetical protein SAMN05216503_3293 [Polaribacter sp. KT25b]|uniref:XAC2610-related protein n=1 Tax=Polaribacter sp. KT25b TaxID=1855336 RepID=UPI0008794AA7|nr:hypothetical protein [Polaribacter sp. KT25b]SDS51078.1 hypothetical protein SAMN05216503_3293 [Polaribacter sp. KT25b]
MKNRLLFYFFFFTVSLNAQLLDLKDKDIVFKTVNKSQIFKVNNFKFNVTWDKKLSYSNNLGSYGGIKELKIYKGNKLVNVFKNIEDPNALNQIVFRFFDYNLDGYIDFSVQIDSGKSTWEKYYLYNPTENKYEHIETWDYLRIQKIDKTNKRILTQPDGNVDNRELFKIEGVKLIEIKRK